MSLLRSICRLVPLLLVAALLTLAPSATAAPASTSTATATSVTTEGQQEEDVRGLLEDDTAADGQVRGLVYNADGDLLDDIEVQAFPAEDPTADPQATALTYEEGPDAHGAYVLHLPPGDYKIRFASPDWAERNRYNPAFYGGGSGETVTVTEGGETALEDMTLQREVGVPVTGVVTGPDGEPLARVDVRLYRFFEDGDHWSIDSARTDSSGRYTFPSAPPGREYSVLAYGGWDWDGEELGYADTWLGDAPGPTLARKFTFGSGATPQDVGAITLRPGVRVHGTITRPDLTDDDYFYASLLLRNTDGSWDEVDYDFFDSGDDFAYQFPQVMPAGTYTVQIDDESGGTTYLGGTRDRDQADTFTLNSSSPAELDLGELPLDTETTAVTGTVLDSEGEGTQAEVTVWQLVDGQWLDVRSPWARENGTYRVRLPWDATWTVSAQTGGDDPVFLGGGASTTDPETRTFTTSSAQPTLALEPITIATSTSRKIVGHVYDEDGQPLAGARVRLWVPYCGGACWDYDQTVFTNDVGRYVLRDDWADEDTFTVSAEKRNGGYPEAFLSEEGGPPVDSVESARTIEAPRGVTTQAGGLTLSLAPGTVRGTVTTSDDGDFDEAGVTLYRWDEWGEYWDWVDDTYTDEFSADYAFTDVAPGTYAVQAEAYDYNDDESPYLPTWHGGTRPEGPTSAGAFTVDGTVNPLDDIDVELQRGVVLSGTVTRGDDGPLEDAWVEVYQWSPAGDSLDYVDDAHTDAQGRYSARVPRNAQLFVSAYREGYTGYDLGGAGWPDTRTTDNSLPTAESDLTHDFQMSPQWQNVGALAGVQDEDCLTNSAEGWWDDDLRFAGRELQIADGVIRTSDAEDGDPLSDEARDPALAPLQGHDWGGTTWGIDQGGDRLCVLWNEGGWGNTRQAFLVKNASGGLDVTYNYDSVAYAPTGRAGWTVGDGPAGANLVLDGWQDGGAGYTDANTDTGLVHNSLGSTQPGRYAFTFDGFKPRGAAPRNTVAPSFEGTLEPGQTITVDPGTWVVDGGSAEDLEFRYRWSGTSEDLVTGDSYTLQDGDRGRRISVDVRAWLPGHDHASEWTSVRVPVGPPAGTNTVLPTVDPAAPSINQEVMADPGEWLVNGGTEADLTFRYRWFVDGRAVDGATAQTFTTRERDANKQLAVRVKALRPDHAPVVVFSQAVTVGDLPAVEQTGAPELTGAPKVGETVSVSDGTWDADGEEVSLSYRFASGHYSRTADAGTPNAYTLKATDRGRYLTVTVVAQAPGHRSAKWSRTIGPVAAGDATLGELRVEVTAADSGAPVAGAFVSACEQETWTCLPGGRTDADGVWTATAWAGVPYQVDVTPPSSSTYRRHSQAVTVEASGTTHTVELTEPTPPPANVQLPDATGTFDGMPTVYWEEPQDIAVTGCAGVANPTYTVTFTDGTPQRSGSMTQGAAGSNGLATYTARIPKFYPSHGETTISMNVPATCEPGVPPTEILIYIDPSGIVTDQYGRPIEGATVTLLRADSAAGPFTAVPDGSTIMSPANRTNPDTTDEVGFFQWDVTEGWYRVAVTAPGCDSTSTNAMQVPPPAIDLLIKMTCNVEPPVGSPTVSGPVAPRVGDSLTTDAGTWAAPLEGKVQWLRGGEPIKGATGESYTLTVDDVGQVISARHTAKRPTYVQEMGRGAPVSFTEVTQTSSGSAAVQKRTSTTRASLPKAKVSRTKAAKITVKVTATPTGASPTGKVTVKKGTKVLKTGNLGAGGKVTLTLPKLPKGKHKLVAKYAGNPEISGSTAPTVTLTVT